MSILQHKRSPWKWLCFPPCGCSRLLSPSRGEPGGLAGACPLQRPSLISLGWAQGQRANTCSSTQSWTDLHSGQSGSFTVNNHSRTATGCSCRYWGINRQIPIYKQHRVIVRLTQWVQHLLHNARVLNWEGFKAENKYSETVLCMLDSGSCHAFCAW